MALRHLSGTIIIEGVDDESWPFSDETVRVVRPVNMYLATEQPASSYSIQPVGWGGECRVEADFKARASADGSILVEGEARLYEGDSENTDDLEDRKPFVLTVHRNTPKKDAATHHSVSLRNSGLGGGDHATLTIDFFNHISEEE